MLQARFSKTSLNNCFQIEGSKAKENLMDEHLPIFQDQNTSNEQMIPQVTVISCDFASSQNNEKRGHMGAGNMIFSDISDELLIKQLQLDLE